MKAVVIIPTYNEKENVQKIVPLVIDEVFPHIKNHQMAVLIADDNSPDGTGEEVKAMMKKYKNLEMVQGPKKGLGAAYVRGMTYAIEKMDADVVFEMDADGQHDATKIPEFMKKIDEGYDMVIGTRYSDGGSIPQNWPPQRKAFSIVANLFVRTVFMKFYIHDWTGGYRALKKEVFLKEKSELEKYSGYIFQISFLHKAVRDGFKIAEVPFHFSDRKLGNSKIAPFGYIMDVVTFVISARIKEFERFMKFLVVGGTGFVVQIVAQEGSIALGIASAIAMFFASMPFFHITDISVFADAVGAGIGAETAIISNFMFNHFWTFSDTHKIHKSSNIFLKLLKFNATSFLAVIIQFSAVWIGEKILGPQVNLIFMTLPTRIVVLIPTIIFIVIPLNYIIYNKIIWKTQYLKHGVAATS